MYCSFKLYSSKWVNDAKFKTFNDEVKMKTVMLKDEAVVWLPSCSNFEIICYVNVCSLRSFTGNFIVLIMY